MLSKLGHTFNGRFQMGWRDGDKVPEALHNIRVRYPLSAVGAVYDRAFGPLACESCAVIDRAYSKNDDVTSVVQNRFQTALDFTASLS